MAQKKKLSHPSYRLLGRYSRDGVKPFSIEEQWELVAEWHAFIESDQADDYPVLYSLKSDWQEIEPVFQGKELFERGEGLRKTAKNPLSTLFYFIEMGFYPPPELLLTLLDCWATYSGNVGRVSLEEAFFEKPQKKGGNFAKRRQSSFSRFMIAMRLKELLQEGKSRIQAAEIISEALGGKPDPESILRMCRGIQPYSKKEN